MADNTPTRKIIDAIGMDRPSAIPTAFNEAIGRHITDALSLKKIEIASKIFGHSLNEAKESKKEIEGKCATCNGKKYDTSKGPKHPCKSCKGTGKVLYEDRKPSEGTTEKERSDTVKKAESGKNIGHGNFDKVEKAGEKEYGSKEAGERVAAAAMWKNLHKK